MAFQTAAANTVEWISGIYAMAEAQALNIKSILEALGGTNLLATNDFMRGVMQNTSNKQAATWTLAAGLMIIGVGVAWRMLFNRLRAFSDSNIDNGLRLGPTPTRSDPTFEIHPKID